MPTDYDVHVIAPFSPLLLKAAMPDNVVADLNMLADRLLMDDNEVRHRDWSHQLAGNIQTEVRITDLIADDFNFMHFLISITREFSLKCRNLMLGRSIRRSEADTELIIRLEDSWINEMVAGDF